MLTIKLPHPINTQARVGHLLHALVAHFRQPELDGLSFRAGHRLDQSQQGLGGGHVGLAQLTVVSGHFQLVTVCHQLTSFLGQPLFQFVPILARGLVVRLLGQGLDDVVYGEPPRLRGIIVETTDLMLLEEGGRRKKGAHLVDR